MFLKWLKINLICLILGIVNVLIFNSYIGTRLEPTSLDLWTQFKTTSPPPDDIVVIGIDLPSYDYFGIKPTESWPRRLHAELLEKLYNKKFKTVAFDVIFKGADLNNTEDRLLSDRLKRLPVIIAGDIWLKSYTNPEVNMPHEIFSNSAKAVAHISFPVDFGTIRRFSGSKIYNQKILYSLAEEATNKRGVVTSRDYLNFYGPSGTFKYIPYHHLFDNNFESLNLKDKLVFIGNHLTISSNASNKDSFTTTLGGKKTFGVEIHATAAANIIKNNFIRRINPDYENLFIFLYSYALSLICIKYRPQLSVVIIFFLLTIWHISFSILCNKGYFLPGFVTNIIFTPVIFLSSIYYYYLSVFRLQSKIRKAFSKYIAPKLVDQIVSNQELLSLGGKTTEITIMFTDIENFTEWVEKSDPEHISKILNKYLTVLANLVLEFKGTLIKFTGDGIFAIWGAPVEISDHSNKALSCAKKILQTLKPQEHGFKTRIGLHRSLAVVGNFGSEQRFDYTAIGDGVNVAARLEKLCKKLNVSVLLSQTMVDYIEPNNDLISLGEFTVPGKSKSANLYTIKI